MDNKNNQRFYLIMSALIISFLVALTTVIKISQVRELKVINIGNRVPIHNLDPAVAFDHATLNVISQSYETLYEYHYLKRPFKIKSLLAQGMPSISEDELTITIKIKKKIPYHDHPAFKGRTRYVVAQDFINQIKRLAFLPLKSSAHSFLKGKLLGFNKFSNATKTKTEDFYKLNIEGLSAPDHHTLIFKFKEKIPHFIYLLTMNFFVPIPIEIINHHSNNFKNVLVGTGPFQLAYYSEDKITLTRFKKYPNHKYPKSGDRFANENNLLNAAGSTLPFLDEVNFRLVQSSQKQFKMLKNSSLDILSVPSKDISAILESKKKDANGLLNYNVQYFPSLISSWLAFNMKDKSVGKGKAYLRKAIAHAINYADYIKKITNNTHLKANSLLSPGIPGYDPKSQLGVEYNPELAKKYLMQAEFGEGKGIPTLIYSTRNDDKKSVFEGEFIKSELAKVGIKVNIQVLSFKQFLRMARTGQLQMWTDNWVFDYPDPQNILQLLFSKNHPGINKSAYWNYKVDTLYLKLNKTSNIKERLEIFRKIESIVQNELPWAMLTYERAYVLKSKCIQNYRLSSFIRNFLKYVDYECR